MVRKKAPKPNQLGVAEQEAECWDMATLNAPIIELCHQDGRPVTSTSTSRPSVADSSAAGSSSTESSVESFKNEQQLFSWDDSAKDPSSCVYTVDSEDSGSTGDIVEVSVVNSLSSCIASNSKSADRKKKKVVFDVSDDDSSYDEDYIPGANIRDFNEDSDEIPADWDDENDESVDYDGFEDISPNNDIEVISETISFPSGNDDDIVLDYDGYEVARKAKERRKRGEIQYYGEFEKVLDECMLNVKISRDEAKNTHCLFNEVKFVLFEDLNSEIWKKCDSCYLYICPDIDSSALYFEWVSDEDEVIAKGLKRKSQKQATKPSKEASNKRKGKGRKKGPIKESSKPSKPKNKKADRFKHYKVNGFVNDAIWRGFGTARYFHLKYKSFDPLTKEVTVEVFLLQSALKDLDHPSDVVSSISGLSDTVCLLFNIDPPVYSGIKQLKQDYEGLYKEIKEHHNGKNYYDESVQHPALIPVLRPYQQAAVRWMLSKEDLATHFVEEEEPKMHCLFVELTALDSTILYYNKYGSYFSKNKPLEIHATPGGILADEMGLGKTVEVLACILNNSCQSLSRPDYLEPYVLEVDAKNVRRKKSAKDDIYLLDSTKANCDSASEESNDEKQQEEEEILGKKSNSKRKNLAIDSDDDYDPLEDITRRKKRSTQNKKRRKVIVESEDETEGVQHNGNELSDSEYDESSASSRTRRSCRKQLLNYSDMDNFCFGSSASSDEEFFTKKQSSSVRKTRQTRRRSSETFSDDFQSLEELPVKKKAKKNEIEEEIEKNSGWSTIEGIILVKCWGDKLAQYKKEGSFKEFRSYLKKRKKDPTYMMTLHEKLKYTYDQETTLYSTADYASMDKYQKKFRQSFFKTKVTICSECTYFCTEIK